MNIIITGNPFSGAEQLQAILAAAGLEARVVLFFDIMGEPEDEEMKTIIVVNRDPNESASDLLEWASQSTTNKNLVDHFVDILSGGIVDRSKIAIAAYMLETAKIKLRRFALRPDFDAEFTRYQDLAGDAMDREIALAMIFDRIGVEMTDAMLAKMEAVALECLPIRVVAQ